MGPQLPTNKNQYYRKFPNVGETKLIGYTGLKNMGFMKKISDKKTHFDLNLLSDEAIHKPDDLDPKLTELLKFISENYGRTSLSSCRNLNLNSARFFCYRGLMTLIATTPYESLEGWKMVVILFNGDIYLCMRKTEKKMEKEKNQTLNDKRFTMWGHKFEQFLLSASPHSDPNPNIPKNELAEFSCFYERNINGHTVIYGAEMDGVLVDNDAISDPPPEDADTETVLKYLDPLKFVELKTHAHFHLGNSKFSFIIHKAKKTWCQCWLTNIQTVVVGFRNGDGIVEELKEYSLDELQKMGTKYWTPNVCISFLDAFFTHVKTCLAYVIEKKYGLRASDNIQDLPLTAMLLEWEPKGNVTMTENWDHDSDVILPTWYTDIIKDLNKNRPPCDSPKRKSSSFKQSNQEHPRGSTEHPPYNSVPYSYDDGSSNSRSNYNPEYHREDRPRSGHSRRDHPYRDDRHRSSYRHY